MDISIELGIQGKVEEAESALQEAPSCARGIIKLANSNFTQETPELLIRMDYKPNNSKKNSNCYY
jgi:hypothetical protein